MIGKLAPPPRAMLGLELMGWAERMQRLILRRRPLTPAQIAVELDEEMDLWFGRLVRAVLEYLKGAKIINRKRG